MVDISVLLATDICSFGWNLCKRTMVNFFGGDISIKKWCTPANLAFSRIWISFEDPVISTDNNLVAFCYELSHFLEYDMIWHPNPQVFFWFSWRNVRVDHMAIISYSQEHSFVLWGFGRTNTRNGERHRPIGWFRPNCYRFITGKKSLWSHQQSPNNSMWLSHQWHSIFDLLIFNFNTFPISNGRTPHDQLGFLPYLGLSEDGVLLNPLVITCHINIAILKVYLTILRQIQTSQRESPQDPHLPSL